MYRINIAKVKGKMGEKGYNISTLANSIEINRNTMAEYMRNPARMPYSANSHTPRSAGT